MKVISIHNFISSSGSGTAINYGSGSDFLTSYGPYGSGSTTLVFVLHDQSNLFIIVVSRLCANLIVNGRSHKVRMANF
jgi:hypothetical protein